MSAERECITEGIVLARYSAGEGSLRVVLYTKALGLVSALAKSAREERSKLRAHLLSGSSGIFRLVKGKETWRVTGVSPTRDAYFSLQEKKRSQEAAARVVGSLRQFVRGEGADEKIYGALAGFLDSLRELSEEYAPEAESVAILKLLSALGYVKPDEKLDFFVSSSYELQDMSRAREARPALIRAINEAIHASGL